MTDLKSCPFCGSEAKITDTEPYAVECANEGCQIDGPCHGNKADAIAAWNRRASPAPSLDLVERLENCAAKLEGLETLPKPYDLYYAVKNDGPGWSYHCAHIGVSEVREAATALTAQAARIAELEGELAGLREALEELAGEIESQRNAITHPHGQRAHFIDSQDQIRVAVLTDILDRAGVALGGTK